MGFPNNHTMCFLDKLCMILTNFYHPCFPSENRPDKIIGKWKKKDWSPVKSQEACMHACSSLMTQMTGWTDHSIYIPVAPANVNHVFPVRINEILGWPSRLPPNEKNKTPKNACFQLCECFPSLWPLSTPTSSMYKKYYLQKSFAKSHYWY